MKKQIQLKLSEIEQTHSVTILHAIESGSRAWGFASSDSDYDIRFIYARSPKQYLLLEKTRDVLEYPIDSVWDINGWDLQKALQLLHRCNTTLIEWLHSPIIYQTCPYAEKLSILADSYFQPRSGIYHYLHTAKKTWKKHLQSEQVKAKKYFYVLRPILACLWILEYKTPPPVPFFELAKQCLPISLNHIVEHLVMLKKSLSETDKIHHIRELDAFLLKQFEILPNAIQKLPKTDKIPWTPFDKIFQEILFQNENSSVILK